MRLVLAATLTALLHLPAFAEATSGPYVGGMASLRRSHDLLIGVADGTEAPVPLGSVLAGYQWGYGGLALALEGEVGTSSGKGVNLTGRVRASWNFSNAQIYGFAGYTRTTDHEATMGYFGSIAREVTIAASMSAPVIGAGAEIALNPELSFRAEVQFTRYKSSDFRFPAFDAFPESHITKRFADAELRFGAI